MHSSNNPSIHPSINPFILLSIVSPIYTCCNALRWRYNELDGFSDHQPHDCFLNSLYGRRSKKTAKLRVTGLCAGNSPVTGEFPAQMASNAENVSIWWRHHVLPWTATCIFRKYSAAIPITVAWHGRHGVPHHRQLDCLFNSFSR